MGSLGRFAVCLVVVGVASRAVAFDPHEHKFIADRGASLAVERASVLVRHLFGIAKPPNPWIRQAKSGEKGTGAGQIIKGDAPKDKDVFKPLPQVLVRAGDANNGEWFSFGDLVAIYGDLRVAVKCNEKTASCDVAQCGDKKLAMCDKGDSAVYAHMKLLTGQYPKSKLDLDGDCVSDAMCLEFLKGALFNETHFATKAVEAYQKWHLEALRWVSVSAKDSSEIGMWRALHYEALALHSLTDLLAAGHILFDRSGAVEKVKKADTGSTGVDFLIGGLSPGGLQGALQGKAHGYFNENGLTVRSLHDGSWKGWTAYGDNHLRKGDNDTRQITYLSKAVEWSVASLFNAYAAFRSKPAVIDQLYEQLKKAPATFEALKLVPIMYRGPCAEVPMLQQKFKACLDDQKYRWVPHYKLVKQLTGTN